MAISSGAQAFPDEVETDWYVLHVAPPAEAEVERRLSRLGLDYRRFTELRKRPRKKMIRAATFPGYIFVSFDIEGARWKYLYHMPGVLDVLSAVDEDDDGEVIARRPIAVPSEVMERLIAEDAGRSLETNREYRPPWGSGDLLRVLDGPFASFTATYVGYHAKLVHCFVHIFGRSTLAMFEPKDLELAD